MEKLSWSEPKILIGSGAIEKHLITDFHRKPGDLDYYLRGVGKKYSYYDWGLEKRIDAHGIPDEIFDMLWSHSIYDTSYERFLGLPDLYTIKVSHATFDIHWQKTMQDIKWFQDKQYAHLNENIENKLYNFWLITHKNNKHRITLNKSNEKFFKDNVDRKYVHDDIHEAVKYNSEPLYKKIKKDQTLAGVDYSKFLGLWWSEKLQLCREEIYVTALERFIIPSNMKMPPRIAYRKAAQKLVTSMTKGWFPKFIINDWKELYEPDVDYIEKFNDALSKNKVRVING